MEMSRFLLLALGLAACGRPFAPETDTVLLLATGDLHSALSPHRDGRGGLARIAGEAARLRRERADVLLLDAGDGVAGTAISSLTRGRAIFTVMTVAGYDAMALGNHEFDHGLEVLADYRGLAAFPLLAANVEGPDGAPVADGPFVILDADGVRVAVTAVTIETTTDITPGGATGDCVFGPPGAALEALRDELRSNSDLVVVLSHQGLIADRALAAEVPWVDVIIGGHSHSETPVPERIGDTLLLHTGHAGRRLGRLDLTVRLGGGGVVASEGRLLDVGADFPVDPDVAAVVNAFEERARAVTSVPVARAPRPISREEVRPLAEEAFREALDTDLGYQNATAIRDGLPGGEILVGDVWAALPFENTLCVLTLEGRALPAWARERLPRVEPERLYTVATTSFVAAHPDRHFPAGVRTVTDTGRSARDAFIDHLKSGALR
jgi:5'-nucleotidase